MDYLRNLGSAAASSILQKSGLTFPFSLGEKIGYFEGKTIWSLHDAVKRDDSSPVSVFIFDANVPNRRNLLPIAKNALRKLRTTRHPDVLKFIDVVETETTIYVITERVQPLGKALAAWQTKPAKERDEWLIWGLHRVVVALAFINDPCQSTHGNVRVDSVFISPSGEWKLGGFDVLSSATDDAAVLYNLGGLIPDANAIMSPEVRNGGWSALKSLDPACADAYALGLLLHSVFNPTHPAPSTLFPPHAPPQPSSRGSIPPSIFPSFKRLLNPNPKTRFTSKAFLEFGMGEKPGDGAGFFSSNGLFKICMGLDGFPLASESEKSSLLRTLKESAASFPSEFASYKILPSLLSSLEHGGASASTILPLVLQLGKNLSPAEYTRILLAPLIRLFASADRGTRMALLDNLPEYADKLDNKTVTDKIWPHIQTGFGDTVAVIREATVRSILLISPKLSDRILNNELLRHLAKSQTDPEPSIRTNTCILLGRIAPSLGYNTKRKVLVPAFTRSLKDSFVHARVAGLMALMATIECFEVDELASKVIPCMSFCLIDQEKLVRDQAFKAIEVFLKRVEAHAARMPETALAPEYVGGPGSGNAVPSQAGLANSAAGAAGALAGWAMTTISKKLATSDLQSSIGGGAERPLSAPPVNGNGVQTTFGSSSGGSSLAGPAFLSSASSSSLGNASHWKANGMQLGAHKTPASTALADTLAAESGSMTAPGGWGDDDDIDLIDVAADTGDWSEFARAPDAPQLEAVHDPDAWGDMLDAQESKPSSPPPPVVNLPNLSSFAPAPRKPVAAKPAARPKPPSTPKPKSPLVPASIPPAYNRNTTPTLSKVVPSVKPTSPPPPPASPSEADGWDNSETVWNGDEAAGSAPVLASAIPLSAMSKEEKATEMARRKEERKQRIAQLKEQKKK